MELPKRMMRTKRFEQMKCSNYVFMLRKKSPWVGAVLYCFLPILSPLVTIVRCTISIALDLQCVLVLHLAEPLLKQSNPARPCKNIHLKIAPQLIKMNAERI